MVSRLLRSFVALLLLSYALGFTSSSFGARRSFSLSSPRSSSLLQATDTPDADDAPARKQRKGGATGKKRKKKVSKIKQEEDKQKLVKEIGERMRDTKQMPQAEAASTATPSAEEESNLLDKLNPFKAGQKLRQSIDTALTSISPERDEKRAMYYLDDRLVDGGNNQDGLSGGGGKELNERTLSERIDQDDYVPEVLVIGATGEVGRLVVRRLLQQQGKCRVRVLVRDLYTKTLNLLGTGVTYCQGDLNNMDSLEYALTDVDKIVFCASAPRPDEDQFQTKFKEYLQETLEPNAMKRAGESKDTNKNGSDVDEMALFDDQANDIEWEQLEAVLAVRAELAEQVDCVGMQNLLRSYQNVRYADYGTSQAAKRSLFKFKSRPEDFSLFAIDEGMDDEDEDTTGDDEMADYTTDYTYNEDLEDDDDEEYDVYEDDDYNYEDAYESDDLEKRQDTSVKTQVQWMRNKFGRAVFVGRIPKATSGNEGGEAAVVSSRLRSREEPDNGIDLSNGFGGFVARVCSDGGTYEAFIRTRAYYESGVEYVCQFTTGTKPTPGRKQSKNKFVTVRLPYERFVPVQTESSKLEKGVSIPPFRGGDVRNIGFRYRSSSNELKNKLDGQELSVFYLALAFIKLYRVQPEPEFVYLSDARIPPVVKSNMVNHDARQLIAASEDGSMTILDDSVMESVANDKMGRSPEETYFKYRGEEALKMSGLSYAIVRVLGYNEVPSGEASSIQLQSQTGEVTAVSRDEVAQVCVNALMDPNALNKSFYVGKKSDSTSKDEQFSSKFQQLPADAVV